VSGAIAWGASVRDLVEVGTAPAIRMQPATTWRWIVRAIVSMTLLLQIGCATVPGGNTDAVASGGAPSVVRQVNPKDPFESWNRRVYAFNDVVDQAVLKPVATAYANYVPSVVRTTVGNFFGNFGDAWSTVNHFLQGKVQTGFEMMTRVGINSFLGLGGLLDVASEAGLERQDEDFGQTLGVWGMPAGPYLVWPVLGPSSVRETLALPLDRGWSPSLFINDGGLTAGLSVVQVVDTRARLLGASRVLDDIALDKYVFLRDAYLSRRRNQVYDGNPPDEPEEADAEDDDGKSKGGTKPGATKPDAPKSPDGNKPSDAKPANR
jgi:phospholipid-binding lipoprotein MlaA